MLFFLKFYGFEFDYKHYGLSVNEKNFGKTFQKMSGYQENTISVESIEQEEIDIGIKCFNYDKSRSYYRIPRIGEDDISSSLCKISDGTGVENRDSCL